ncbi:MAG: hypothetical protein GY820_38605 [Gammaproteobacteria bacterium]|nr:hypothetical protein [Gammaproteobacteria bacterium]
MSIGRQIQELHEQIAASLYVIPATLDELMERDFLHNTADFMIDQQLSILLRRKWIYQTADEKYHTYKKTVEKELSEYDLL